MWLLCLFDLPVKTKRQVKKATLFRKFLLEDGFQMMQYSVYLRPCPSEDIAQLHEKRIKRNLPEKGEVRIIKITDAQYGRMFIFSNNSIKVVKNKENQLNFF